MKNKRNASSKQIDKQKLSSSELQYIKKQLNTNGSASITVINKTEQAQKMTDDYLKVALAYLYSKYSIPSIPNNLQLSSTDFKRCMQETINHFSA